MRRSVPVLLALISIQSYAQSKIDPELTEGDLKTPRGVIVLYKNGHTKASYDHAMRKGGRFRRVLHAVQGANYEMAPKDLQAVADDPEVEGIYPDRQVFSMGDTETAAININAARNANLTGAGIGVAILDSGVSFVPPAYSQDFTNSIYGTEDGYGHGTHVAGVIASTLGIGTDGGDGFLLTRDMRGVAPGVRIVNLRC